MYPNNGDSRYAYATTGPLHTSQAASFAHRIANSTTRSLTSLAEPSPESAPELDNHHHRDSVGSIIDDPFFQAYDPAVQAAAASDISDSSSDYQSLDDEDYEHEHKFHDLSNAKHTSNTQLAANSSTRDQVDQHIQDSDENTPTQNWPPPRRESLTTTAISHWVCCFFNTLRPTRPSPSRGHRVM